MGHRGRRIAQAASWAVAAGIVGGAVPVASADWWESFDSGFSQSWTFVPLDDAGDPPATGMSEFAIIESGADDYLRISHTTTAIRDGGGGATDGYGLIPEVFTDVLVSAEINSAPGDGQQSALAVFARGNTSTGAAYVAGVNFYDSYFAIARADGFGLFLTPLAVDFSATIDSNTTYRVDFLVQGSNLQASLYDSTGTIELSSIAATDASYSSGVSGVLVETAYDALDNPIAPIVGTFDDVHAVPEPSQPALLVAGSLLLWRLGRRRLFRGGRGANETLRTRPHCHGMRDAPLRSGGP